MRVVLRVSSMCLLGVCLFSGNAGANEDALRVGEATQATPSSDEEWRRELVRQMDAAKRRFETAPSLSDWASFGSNALERWQSDSWRAGEGVVVDIDEATGAPHLPPNPAFDAMMKRLAEGIVVARPAKLVVEREPWLEKRTSAGVLRVPLPVVKPSFFADGELAVMVPAGWLENLGGAFSDYAPIHDGPGWFWSETGREFEIFDALSAYHRARVRVVQTAPFGEVYDGNWVGVWRVGAMRIDYSPAARIVTVAPDGRVGALPVTSMLYEMGNSGCRAGRAGIIAPPRPASAPALGDYLVAWVGREPQGATVISRQFNGRDSVFDRLLVHEIDLNADGFADFVVYEGRYQPEVGATGLWTEVHANVGGRWLLVHQGEDADCT